MTTPEQRVIDELRQQVDAAIERADKAANANGRPLPPPPAGHYWRIKDAREYYPARIIELRERRHYWFDKTVHSERFQVEADEDHTAEAAVELALMILHRHRLHTVGLNGLSGYVDEHGRAR